MFEVLSGLSKWTADNIELSHVLLFDEVVEFGDDIRVVSLNVIPEYLNDHFLFVGLLSFFFDHPTWTALDVFVHHFLEEYFNFFNELLFIVFFVGYKDEIGRFDEESAYFFGGPGATPEM